KEIGNPRDCPDYDHGANYAVNCNQLHSTTICASTNKCHGDKSWPLKLGMGDSTADPALPSSRLLETGSRLEPVKIGWRCGRNRMPAHHILAGRLHGVRHRPAMRFP